MTLSEFTTTAAEAAARYAAWNWPVIPVHMPTSAGCSCGHPDCTNRGKHPRLQRGVHQASTTRAQIAAWWERWPQANVAIATGLLVVIDVDGDRGTRSLEALQERYGELPSTAWVQTGRGRHLYFYAGGLDVRNSAGRLGPGLDVRGRGGYAIAPPSIHHTGHRYVWHELDAGIPLLPCWLAEAVAPPRRSRDASEIRPSRLSGYIRAALHGELRRITAAPPGTRNDTLNRSAFRLGQLAGAGLTDTVALEAPLFDAACAAGLTEREARATIASGLVAGTLHPRPRASRSSLSSK